MLKACFFFHELIYKSRCCDPYKATVFTTRRDLLSDKMYVLSSHQQFLDFVSTVGSFSCMQVSLYLARAYGYYIAQVYVPSVLIVVLSWVNFWLDIDAIPARISLGLLSVLTMTTMSVGEHTI